MKLLFSSRAVRIDCVNVIFIFNCLKNKVLILKRQTSLYATTISETAQQKKIMK